ncbi:hypothetical protein CUU95_11675 [Vreelandella alkaliphila]|uniref:hypothetical protein n=1 Tax=Vreelandella alkaliphila TaxID=272774 RepID=UPI000EA320C6|nr:hypothetical protein [Halomonas alkaliphila]AYF34422.1 hypothetical protein CUU95_11675 [Halomonas alkaliphila]
MIYKLITDFGFLSSLVGFLGILLTTTYGWFLDKRLRVFTKEEKERTTSASDQDNAKLEAARNISRKKKEKDLYLSKITNRVFLILAISFAIAIGGIYMSIEEKSKLEDRIEKIEDYLWPSPDSGDGSPASLSEKVDSLQNSMERIQGLQTKIIETIHEQVQHPSEALERKVRELNREIEALKKKIAVMKRQQGGEASATL